LQLKKLSLFKDTTTLAKLKSFAGRALGVIKARQARGGDKEIPADGKRKSQRTNLL
jgi:hypothetical protein